MSRLGPLWLLALAACCAFACSRGDRPPKATSTPEATPTPAFKPAFSYGPCGFDLPEGQREAGTISCGTLTVLENRQNPAEGTIRLAVAVLSATGSAAEPDPLIYLAGGPGGPALENDMQEFTRAFAAPIQRGRDIVFFDQRGVGQSRPALDCSEVDALSPDDDDATYDTAIAECRTRLQGLGVDIDAYNSVESAADIVDLASALGYDSYNLYGVSYGTRLALTAMREAPAKIRSVVLDSSFPPQANLYADGAVTLEESLQALFDACDRDRVCRGFAPDLRGTFFSIVDRLQRSPAIVEAEESSGDTIDVSVDGNRFINLIFQAMYDSEVIRYLPSGIVAIAGGDTDPLSYLSSYAEYAESGEALGMYLSVQCSEEVPFNTDSVVRDASSAAYAPVNDATRKDLATIRGACDSWHAAPRDASENDAVNSDVPALILSGGFDPITPPSYARETARTLSHSTIASFPTSGHGVLDSGCSMDIVASFLDDPAAAPDLGCIDDIRPISFEAP